MKRSMQCLLLALLPACSAEPGDNSTQVESNQLDLVASITESPNPLVFPNATVGAGACGSVGSTSCTYASITISNRTAKSQTITAAGATAPFWVTWGGTCNSTQFNKTIPSQKSCTLEFGFLPTTPGTVSNGAGTVNFASGTVLTFALKGTSNPEGTLSATPNPLVFPNATVGGGACGSAGSTSCTYASITLSNKTSTAQTITAASASSPFWVTWGGTCNSTQFNKVIPSQSSCTLEFGFLPSAAGTVYNGSGGVTFASGKVLSFGLKGSSN
jgi:hypothetical protein